MLCIFCLAVRVMRWQVLHCVLYPRLEYDVPILSLDMVGREAGGVSLAIVDLCPCVVEGHIPLAYREAARSVVLAILYYQSWTENASFPDLSKARMHSNCLRSGHALWARLRGPSII